jgi:chromosome segregation protein
VERGLIRFYAEESAQAGLLARRSKIEQLEAAVKAQQLMLEEAIAVMQRAESDLNARRSELSGLRDRAQSAQARAHELALAEVKLDEKIQRLSTQDAALLAALAQLRQELDDVRAQLTHCEQSTEEAESRLITQTGELERQKSLQESQAHEVDQARLQMSQAEQAVQEALLAQRLAQEQRRVFEERMRESIDRAGPSPPCRVGS